MTELPCLSGKDGQVVIAVTARPGAKRVGVQGLHGPALKLAVRAQAQKGKANAELVALLADLLGVPPSAVTLHRGASARVKQFKVEGLTLAAVEAALSSALAELGAG